jgi:hypothetical protein
MTAFESSTIQLPQSQESSYCALIQDLLPLYLEGEVNPISRDQIAEHISHCNHCSGFLAGARSMHSQLQMELQQRQAAIAQSKPQTQRLFTLGSLVVTLIATLASAAMGSMSVVWIVEGLRWQHGLLLFGLPMFSISLTLLVLIARTRGPLTIERMLFLICSCLIGGIASALIFNVHSAIGAFTGFGSGLAALVLLWCTIWNVPFLPKSPASFPNHQS